MNTVNAAADETARDAGRQGYAIHVRGGVRGWGSHRAGGRRGGEREVLADHRIEERYANQHASKRRELEALQRADSEPRQIIMGHDGNTVITLETKHNLSKSLDDISIGDTVTWTGHRVSADSDSESWNISTIKTVG